MAYRISIAELGVANDNAVIEGETPGDVWRQVKQHLKDEHKIKLPDLEDVGGEGLFPVVPRFDNAAVAGQQGPVIATAGRFESDDREVQTIVTRLIEKLRMGGQASGGSDAAPPGAAASTLP